MSDMYDVIIVGSGPAGLAAAIYGMRADLNLIVIEKNPVSGGQVLDTYEVDNYPGLPGMNGFDLGEAFRSHADKLGAKFVNATVSSIIKDDEKGTFTVSADGDTYTSKTVVLATGANHAHLGVPGEEKLSGMGVSYCATCDGAFFRGKTVAVVGGGDVAAEDAIFLSRMCEKVYLIHRRDELRAVGALRNEVLSTPNIEPVWDSVVTSIEGDDRVSGIIVKNVKTDEKKEIEVSACFIAVGINPDTSLVKGVLGLNDGEYVPAGEDGATTVPGLYVAGDIRKKRLRQIVTAVADGANVITAISDFL